MGKGKGKGTEMGKGVTAAYSGGQPLDDGGLSEKQRAFVNVYDKGEDGAVAVLAAGYSCKNSRAAYCQASKLLKNPKIQRAIVEKIADDDSRISVTQRKHKEKVERVVKLKKEIAAMDVEVLKGHIATRIERKVFWTQTMMDEEERIVDRLRASELLGRAETDFIEKKEVNVGGGFAVISTPEVRGMIEEITGVRLPEPILQLPEPIGVLKAEDVEDVGLVGAAGGEAGVVIDMEPGPEIESNVDKLVEWVEGIKGERNG